LLHIFGEFSVRFSLTRENGDCEQDLSASVLASGVEMLAPTATVDDDLLLEKSPVSVDESPALISRTL